MGVMIRAWLQARAIGPFCFSEPERITLRAQVKVANGKVAAKMIAK